MPGVALEGSIPSLVAGLMAFVVLVLVRVALTKPSGLGNHKEVTPMTENRKTGMRSVLETIWAVGVGYLAGVLPT